MESYWDNSAPAGAVIIDPNDPLFVPEGRVGECTPAYTLIGLNIRVDNFIRESIFLNLNISNLTDQLYHTPTSSDNTIYNKGMVGYGRSVLVSVGLTF